VVVIGGGNAAVDAARVSCLMGARSVMICIGVLALRCRPLKLRSTERERRGVNNNFPDTPQEVLTTDEGMVRGLKCLRHGIRPADADGRRNPPACQRDGG